jgi:hypothetical protein
MTADLIAPTLRFLADIARDTFVKNWLGQPENCAFWGVLLRSLCASGSSCMLISSGNQTVSHITNTELCQLMNIVCIESYTIIRQS